MPASRAQPPDVSLLSHGYQYLTEQRYDQMEPVLEIVRRDIIALGLPLRSIEVEFGPSQCEFTFQPTKGLAPADTMVLFRSAVKQICHRHGYHATFMCRPKLPNVVASGWHLHQSIVSRAGGDNAFMAKDKGEVLSAFGRHYLAGLLKHARAAAVFTTPTINGYKRYRSYSLAPDRAIWGRDNRGVMIRVLGGADDPATRLENRIGEPAANPYLYMASQILSGLDGVDRKLDPGPSADTPYETEAARCRRRCAKRCPRSRTIRSFAMHWARSLSTTTSTSRTPKSNASRPKYRTGNSANISRCFEGYAASKFRIFTLPWRGRVGSHRKMRDGVGWRGG